MNDYIFCIGDSHVSVFSGLEKEPIPAGSWFKNNKDNFLCFRTGPHVAFSFSTRLTEIQSMVQNIPRENYILFLYGEIDCRAHIKKTAEKLKETEEEITNWVVEAYIKACCKIKEMGFKVIVWSPPLPICDMPFQKEFPTYGSLLERTNITNKFNEKLKLAAQENGLIYCTINEVLLKNKQADIDFYMDKFHLDSVKCLPFIKEELQKKGIRKI